MNYNIWRRWVKRLFELRVLKRVRPRRGLGLERLEDRVVPVITNNWTGVGGPGNLQWDWTNGTTTNWSAGIPTAGENLVFAATIPSSGATIPIADRATIDDINPGAYNSITISGSNYSIGVSGAGEIELAGSLNVDSNLSNPTPITITPEIMFTGQQAVPAQPDQTVTVDGGSTLDLQGQLVGAGTPLQIAQQALLLDGPGVIQLDNNNKSAASWTGSVTIADGATVVMTNEFALGSGAAVSGAPNAGVTTIDTLSELELDPSGASFANVPENLIINGAGVSNNGALFNETGNNTYGGTVLGTGDIQMASATTFGAAPNTTLTIGTLYGGIISDLSAPQNLTTEGGGTVVFAHPGGNTYRGTTTVQYGILEIEDPYSLGAGAGAVPGVASGTPQDETVVNYNEVTGQGGTLELNFVAPSASGGLGVNDLGGVDPNGILTNASGTYSSTTNPYIGFQVFNDLLVLNGPGVTGLGALYNLHGDNGWDGNVILGSVSSSDSGSINIGVNANTGTATAPNTDLTISGVISELNQTGYSTQGLDKVGGGRLILTDANTFTGNTSITDGEVQITDSTALSTGAVTVNSGTSLELAVDSGDDGTLLSSHGRNLGSDSVTGSGPGQEIYIGGSSGTFKLNFAGEVTSVLNVADPNLAADMQTALNALPIFAADPITVTQDGDIYRLMYGEMDQVGAGDSIPLITTTTVSGSPDLVVNPIYGLNVANALTEDGDGANAVGGSPEGALVSLSGINIYTGSITMGGGGSSIGVLPDNDFLGFPGEYTTYRTGHPTADDNYFNWDYSLTVTGAINNQAGVNTLTKYGEGQLILPGSQTGYGYTTGDLGGSGVANPSTIVEAGWITVETPTSLGTNIAPNGTLPQTNLVTVQVDSQASVQLDPQGALEVQTGSTGSLVLSYTGLDAAGNMVTDPTTPISLSSATLLTDIQKVLNALGNIGGVGGFTIVTETSPNVYSIAFGGTLNVTDLHNLAVSTQPTTGGAAVASNPLSWTSYYNWILSGTGISQPFSLIDQGALESMAGDNVLNGIIQLDSATTGVGVEQVQPVTTTPALTASQLTLTDEIENYPGITGGLVKLGTRRLVIDGTGSYTGNVVIQSGVLLDQSNTGLGAGNTQTTSATPSVTVDSGAALELGNEITTATALELNPSAITTSTNGGLSDGLGIWGENLILNGTGDATFGDNALTVVGGDAPTGGTVDTLTITGSMTGGYFLSYGGVLTSEISATATAAQVQSALNALSTIGGSGGSVSVFQSVNGNANVYTITFAGTLIDTTTPILAPDSFAAVSGVATVPVVTGGNFSLAFGGQTTTSLPASATPTQVMNALIALTSINMQGVSSVTLNASGTAYIIQFSGSLASTNAPVTLFTGTFPDENYTIPAVPTTQTGLATSVSVTATGSFSLSFGGVATSTPLSNTSTASQVQTALEGLSTIGSLGVAVSGGAGNYTITFAGSLINTSTSLVASGAAVVSESLTTAVMPYGDPLNPADDLWNGPVDLTASASIAVETNPDASIPDSRLVINGNIIGSDSNLTIEGGGELNLEGTDSYGGSTFIDQGVLTIGSNEALGGTPVSEVQTLWLAGLTANTNYTLTFEGYTGLSATTPTLTYLDTGADAGIIQAALNALSTIGGAGSTTDAGGVVSVTEPTAGVFQITYEGTLTGFQQNLLTANVGVQVYTATDTGAGDQIGGGGTVVANGASLQLAGSFTVAGMPLLVEGNGGGTLNIPTQWFQVGPAGTTGGQTTGNDAVAGSVTGIVTDPENPNIIYIATAGGGAWKTIDGGLSWIPIFDSIPEIQTVTISGAGSFSLTFTDPDGNVDTTPLLSETDPNLAVDMQTALNNLADIGGEGGVVSVSQSGNQYSVSFAGTLAGLALTPMIETGAGAAIGTKEVGTDNSFAMYIGAIAMDPGNDNTLYLGTGETNNSSDSYYGTGVYETTNGGITWQLVTGTESQQLTVEGQGTQIQEVNLVGKGYEEQSFNVTGTKGDYVLTYHGSTSTALPYNATSAQIQTALNAIVGSYGPVIVGGGFTGPGTVDVYFLDDANTGIAAVPPTIPLLGGHHTGTTGSANVNGFAELIPLGQFQVAFGGQMTIPLPYDATSNTIAAALNTASAAGGYGNTLQVTPETTNQSVPDTYTYTTSGTVGTYTLSWNNQTTSAIADGASAATVQAALAALAIPPSVSVTMYVSNSFTNTDVYSISFTGSEGYYEQLPITGAGATDATNTYEFVSSGAYSATAGFYFTYNGTSTSLLSSNAATDKADLQAILPSSITISSFNVGVGAGNIFDFTFTTSEPVQVGISSSAGIALTSPGTNGGVGSPIGTPYVLEEKGGMSFDVTYFDPTTIAAALPEITNVTTANGITYLPYSAANTIPQVVQQLGTYTISLNNGTTVTLPYDATAAEIQTALDNIMTSAGYTGGTVTVTTTPITETQWFQSYGGAGTFTLSWDGYTVSGIAYNASAATIQADMIAADPNLNNGFTVQQDGDAYYFVFSGSLTSATGQYDEYGQPLITVTPAGGDEVTYENSLNTPGGVVETGNPLATGSPDSGLIGGPLLEKTVGGELLNITFGGSLANSPVPTLTIATANSITTPSVDATVSQPFNPFYLKGISAIQALSNGTLFVSDGDGGNGVDEIQDLVFKGFGIFPAANSTFTLSFTNANSTGAVVTDTTQTLDYLGTTTAEKAAMVAEIETALDGLGNIGAVGGSVVVTTQTVGGGPHGGGTLEYVITFEGSLSDTLVQTLIATPNSTNVPNSIEVLVATQGGPNLVVNGSTNEGADPVTDGLGGAPGIWQFIAATPAFTNLTGSLGTTPGGLQSSRVDTLSETTGDATYGPDASVDPGPQGFPDTPGPDDDYRISFPQSGNTWSDVVAVELNANEYMLYAALGTAGGSTDNGVYWAEVPAGSIQIPTWYVGNPWQGSISAANAKLTPDNETDEFVNGKADPSDNVGNIKISATDYLYTAGGTYANEPIPNEPSNPVNEEGYLTVYASVTNATGNGLLGVYVSTAGGVNWAAVTTEPANYMSNEGFYDNAIVVDPTNPNEVFVGGSPSNIPAQSGQILESLNGGVSWNDISIEAGNDPHASQHVMELDGYGNLLVGNDGGIWRFNIGTSVWSDLNGNLAISQVDDVAANPNSINSLAAGIQNNGVSLYDQSSQIWAISPSSGAGEMGGGQIYIDPSDPEIMYAVQTQLGANAIFEYSTNGGASWTQILSLLFSANQTIQSSTFPLVMDPLDPERLVVGGGTNTQLFESFSGGLSWSNNLDTPGIQVQLVALSEYQGSFVPDSNFPDVTDKGTDSYDSNTIYISDGTNIYVTKDNAQNWENLNFPATGKIVQLVVDPRNRDTLYAVVQSTGSGQVWMYTDTSDVNGVYNPGGWSEIGDSFGLPSTVPAWSLAVDPRNGNLYVGDDLGVYELIDGAPLSAPGTVVQPGIISDPTWQRVGIGMPDVQVRSLTLNLQTNTLLAGTYGRSVYELFLDADQIAVNEAPVQAAVVALSGNTFWTGPVILSGDPSTNTVTFGADGVQDLPDQFAAASLDFVGPISDLTENTYPNPLDINPTLDKDGGGDIIFSGDNIYGGYTNIEAGVLIADNLDALGGTTDGTTVEDGATLALEADLDAEPVTLIGDGNSFDGHYQGSLFNISGDNTFAGTITLDTSGAYFSVTVGANPGSELTLTGSITGGDDTNTDADTMFRFVKEGTGTISIENTSPDTYVAITDVYEGALQLETANAVSDGDGTINVLDGAQVQVQNQQQVQSLVVSATSGIFALSFTAPNSLGVTVTDSTDAIMPALPPLSINGNTPTALASLIEDSLNALSNIGGVGGTVTVTYTGSGVYSIVFGGTLLGEALPLLAVVDDSTLSGGTVSTQPVPVEIENPLNLSGTGIFGTGALEDTSGNNYWLGPIAFTMFPGFSPDTTPPGGVAIGVLNPGDVLTLGTSSTTNEIIQTTASGTDLQVTGTSGGDALVTPDNYTPVNSDVGDKLVITSGTGWTLGTYTILSISAGQWKLNGSPAALDTSGGYWTLEGGLTLGLQKVGAGTLAIPSTTSYGGQTEIVDGILLVQNNQALGSRNTTAPQNTIQQIVTVSDTDAGTFEINFDGKIATFTFGASSSSVGNKLDALMIASGLYTSAGHVLVAETQSETTTEDGGPSLGSPTFSNIYTITFEGTAAETDVSLQVFGLLGTTAAASFVAQPNTDVQVDNGGELDLGTPSVGSLNLDYNVTLNGDGANADGHGALYNLAGNNSVIAPYTVASASQVGVNGNNDVQLLTIPATASGPFILSFTDPLATGGAAVTEYTANDNLPPATDYELNTSSSTLATDIQSALDDLPNIGGVGGSVTVTETSAGSGIYAITFGGTLSGVDVPLLQVSTQPAGGNIAIANNEEVITIPSSASGNFVLGFSGPDATGNTVTDGTQESGQFELNTASATLASDIQNALNGFSNIGGVGGSVSVAETAPGSGIFTVTFGGTLAAEDVQPLTVPSGGTITIAAGQIGSSTTLDLDATGTSDSASADMEKVGVGTLVIPAGKTFTGPTIVTQGVLQVDGTITSIGTPSSVTLNGGTLSGSSQVGTISSTAKGGTIIPADINPSNVYTEETQSLLSVGPNTLANPVDVLGAGDTFEVDLGANGVNDALNVTNANVELGNGVATLSGTISVALGSVVQGDTYTIIQTTGTITGQFAGPTPSTQVQPSVPSGAYPYATVVYIDGEMFVVNYFATKVTLTRELVPASLTLAIGPATNNYLQNPNAGDYPVNYTVDYGQDVNFTATLTTYDIDLPTDPNLLSGTFVFTVIYTDPIGDQYTFTIDEPIASSVIASGPNAGEQVGTYTLDESTIAQAFGTAFSNPYAAPYSVPTSPLAPLAGNPPYLIPNGNYSIKVYYSDIPTSPPYPDVTIFNAQPDPTSPITMQVIPTPDSISTPVTTGPTTPSVPTNPDTSPYSASSAYSEESYYGQNLTFTSTVTQTSPLPNPTVPSLSGLMYYEVTYTPYGGTPITTPYLPEVGAYVASPTVDVSGGTTTITLTDSTVGLVADGDTVNFGDDPTNYTIVGSTETAGNQVTSITIEGTLTDPVTTGEVVAILPELTASANAAAIGATTVTLSGLSGVPTAGETVNFGSDSTNYTITAYDSVTGQITLSTGLVAAVTAGEEVEIYSPLDVRLTDTAPVGTSAFSQIDLASDAFSNEPWWTPDGINDGTYVITAVYPGFNQVFPGGGQNQATYGAFALTQSSTESLTVIPTPDSIGLNPTSNQPGNSGGFNQSPPTVPTTVLYGQYNDDNFTTTITEYPNSQGVNTPAPTVPPLSGYVVYEVNYTYNNDSYASTYYFAEPLLDTSSGGTTAFALLDMNTGYLTPSDIPEVQTITLSPTAGSFDVEYPGPTQDANGLTQAIVPADPTALQLQDALESLSSIGQSNVTVIHKPGTEVYTVVFDNNLLGNLGSPEPLVSTNEPSLISVQQVQAGGEFENQVGGTTSDPWQTDILAAASAAVAASGTGPTTIPLTGATGLVTNGEIVNFGSDPTNYTVIGTTETGDVTTSITISGGLNVAVASGERVVINDGLAVGTYNVTAIYNGVNFYSGVTYPYNPNAYPTSDQAFVPKVSSFTFTVNPTPDTPSLTPSNGQPGTSGIYSAVPPTIPLTVDYGQYADDNFTSSITETAPTPNPSVPPVSGSVVYVVSYSDTNGNTYDSPYYYSVPLQDSSATSAFALLDLNSMDSLTLAETQTITDTTGGSFYLSFGSSSEVLVPANATAVQLQQCLDSLSTIGSGGVTVMQNGDVYTVVFNGALADVHDALISNEGDTNIPVAEVQVGGTVSDPWETDVLATASTVTPGPGTTTISLTGATGVVADGAIVNFGSDPTNYTVISTTETGGVTTSITVSGTATVTSGESVVVNDGLAVGTYKITTNYNGVNNSGYLAFVSPPPSTITFNVVATPDTIGLTDSVPSPADYGQLENFTATVTLSPIPIPSVPPLSGQVEFEITYTSPQGVTSPVADYWVNLVDVAGTNGTEAQAVLNASSLPDSISEPLLNGTYSIVAYFNGINTSGYLAFAPNTSSTLTLEVIPTPDTITLASSVPNSIEYGQYQSSSEFFTSTVTLSPTPNPSVPPLSGQVEFEVTYTNLQGVASPTVDFYETLIDVAGTNGTQATAVLNSSTMTEWLTNDGLEAGTYSIVAYFNGLNTALYQAFAPATSSPPLSLQIGLPNVSVSVASNPVASSGNPLIYGEGITFSATLNLTSYSPPVPPITGQVLFTLINTSTNTTIFSGDEQIVDGSNPLQATAVLNASSIPALTAEPLVPDDYTITVSYNGINSSGVQAYTPASSSPDPIYVNKASTAVNLQVSDNNAVYSEPEILTATVSSLTPSPIAGTIAPTGTVTFEYGSTIIATVPIPPTSPPTYGTSTVFTYTWIDPAIGTYPIVAVYSGDTNYKTSSSSQNSVTIVEDHTTTNLTSTPPSPYVYGEPVTFTASVTADSPGTGIPTGTVEFVRLVSGSVSVVLANNVPLVNGVAQATVTTAGLLNTASNEQIEAIYSGDPNEYFGSDGFETINVGKDSTTTSVIAASPTSIVYGEPATFTAEVLPNVTANGSDTGLPTGNVEFFENGTAIGEGTLSDVGGVMEATYETTSPLQLPVNASGLTISAEYVGDTNYSTSTSSGGADLNLPVNQDSSVTTMISAFPSPAAYGEPVTITADVTAGVPGAGTPTGSVNFYYTPSGGSATFLGTGALTTTNGVTSATFTTTTTQLPYGELSLTAVYQGDSNFLASPPSAGLNEFVGADSTTTVLTSSAPAPDGSVYGQQVTFTAVVTANAPGTGTPTGSVEFENASDTVLFTGALSVVNGVNQATYTTSYPTSNLPIGSNQITAVYVPTPGDDNYAQSDETLTQTVNPDPTTTSVKTSGPSVYGNPVTLTATVSANSPGAGNPQGTVTFYVTEGSSLVNLGSQTLNTSTGNTSTASIMTSAVPVGSGESITAIYSPSTGPDDFVGSQGTTSQTVTRGVVSVQVANVSGVYGQLVTLSVVVEPTLAPATPTGTVDFSIGSTLLASGIALQTGAGSATASYQITQSQLAAVGNNTITVSYSGDGNYQSTSGTGTLSVTADSTTTVLTTTSSTPNVGQIIGLTATVSANSPGVGSVPTGTVTFEDIIGGTPKVLGSASLSGGVAVLNTSLTTVGSQTVAAIYSGSTDYLATSTSPIPVSAEQTEDVLPVGSRISKVTVVSSLNPSQYGDPVTFTATVKDAGAAPAKSPTGTVTFLAGATILGTGTLSPVSAGVATASFTTSADELALSPSGGTETYSIVAVYAGDSTFAKANSTGISQTVNPVPVRTSTISLASAVPPSVSTGSGSYSSTYGQALKFVVTVTDTGSGAKQTPTGKVTFVYQLPDSSNPSAVYTLGTETLTASTAGVATATLPISTLAPNTYTIEATYNGNLVFAADATQSITQVVNQIPTSVTLTSTTANDTSVYGQLVAFTAKVKETTSGAGAPGSVVFTDQTTGVVLGTVALTSGVAVLKTSKLAVGSHDITVTYAGNTNVASNSASLTQNVNQDDTKVTLAASSATSNVPVTFTATVTAVSPGTGIPTGTVTFYIDNSLIETVSLNGSGKAVLTPPVVLTSGLHTIEAVYSGDQNFLLNSEIETINFTVGRST